MITSSAKSPVPFSNLNGSSCLRNHVLRKMMFSSQLRNYVKGDHSSQLLVSSQIIGAMMLLVLCTMLVITCATSIPRELSGKPRPAVTEVLALSVSGLHNVSRANIGAKWDVIVAVHNPNLVSTLSCDHTEGMVLYQDEAVAVSSSTEPFVLGPKEHRIVGFRMWGIDRDQPLVKDYVVATMNLSVNLGFWARIRCGWWWTKSVIMNPRCKDLSVDLEPKRGFGVLLHDEPIECHVPMLDN